MILNKGFFCWVCIGSSILSGISLRNWIQPFKRKRICKQDRVFLVTLLFSSFITVFHGKICSKQVVMCFQAPARSKLHHRQDHARSLHSWHQLSGKMTSQDAPSPKRKRRMRNQKRTVNSSEGASNLGLFVLLQNTSIPVTDKSRGYNTVINLIPYFYFCFSWKVWGWSTLEIMLLSGWHTGPSDSYGTLYKDLKLFMVCLQSGWWCFYVGHLFSFGILCSWSGDWNGP